MKTCYERQQTKTNLGAAHTLCLELLDCVQYIFLQTLTTKDCKGPQTNMPKNVAIDSPKEGETASYGHNPALF